MGIILVMAGVIWGARSVAVARVDQLYGRPTNASVVYHIIAAVLTFLGGVALTLASSVHRRVPDAFALRDEERLTIVRRGYRRAG